MQSVLNNASLVKVCVEFLGARFGIDIPRCALCLSCSFPNVHIQIPFRDIANPTQLLSYAAQPQISPLRNSLPVCKLSVSEG
jgi:hypothetical protein